MGDDITDTSRAREMGRAFLWSLGAAFTAAAAAYAGWLLMVVGSLYASGAPIEASRLEPGTRSEHSQAAEPATALAPYSPPAVAPPPSSQEFVEPRLALSRAEVAEVQQRLKGLGFDPGRVDGAPGNRTQEAVRRYQWSRNAIETGAVDRQLLDKLRADPVPLLPPAPAQTAVAAPARPTNPVLASIKAASDRLSRWLNSIGH